MNEKLVAGRLEAINLMILITEAQENFSVM